jgi:hypothetical protein
VPAATPGPARGPLTPLPTRASSPTPLRP